MLSDKKKLEIIRDYAKLADISYYEIGENTSVSQKTAYNILNDDKIIPRRKSLDIVLEYLERKVVGTQGNVELRKNYLKNKEVTAQFNEDDIEYDSGVPYYDVEFAAGFEDFTQNQLSKPTSFIQHPFFNGCDYVIRASGQSMSKIIKHGDAIGIKELHNWHDFLPFGEIYAIVTKDNFRMIKVITKGETEDTFTLISKPAESKKDEFPPQQIKKSLILAIFKVQASSYLF